MTFTGAVHKTDKEIRRAVQAAASDDTFRKLSDKVSFGVALDPLKKAIVKATSLEIVAPKEKHVQTILQTARNPGQQQVLIKHLLERLNHADAAVVLKACIVFHRLMRESEETAKFTKALFGHMTNFNKSQFADDKSTDAFEMSELIRSYCEYLEEKLHVTRQLKQEYERDYKDRKERLQRMSDDEILHDLPPLQTQLEKALRVEIHESTSNQTCIAAFAVLFKDTINLYRTVNEGVMKLLENYFESDIPKAKAILSIYKAFDAQTKRLTVFFENAKSLLSKDVGTTELKGAPESFMKALEQYIESGGKAPEEALPDTVKIELEHSPKITKAAPAPAAKPTATAATKPTAAKTTSPSSQPQKPTSDPFGFGDDFLSAPVVAPAPAPAPAPSKPAAAKPPTVDLLGDDSIDKMNKILMDTSIQPTLQPIQSNPLAGLNSMTTMGGLGNMNNMSGGGMQSMGMNGMGSMGSMGMNSMQPMGMMGGMQPMGMMGGMQPMGMGMGMGMNNMGMQQPMGMNNMGMQQPMGMNNMGMQQPMGMNNMGMQQPMGMNSMGMNTMQPMGMGNMGNMGMNTMNTMGATMQSQQGGMRPMAPTGGAASTTGPRPGSGLALGGGVARGGMFNSVKTAQEPVNQKVDPLQQLFMEAKK